MGYGEVGAVNGPAMKLMGEIKQSGMLDDISDIVTPLKKYFGVTNILLGVVIIGLVVIGIKIFKKDDDSVKRGKRDIDNSDDNIKKNFYDGCIRQFNDSEDHEDVAEKNKHKEIIARLRRIDMFDPSFRF